MELLEKITIAVDGFSSCGKSSYAKLIAKKLNYIYIDSGAMYRAVALYAMRNNWLKPGHVNEQQIIGKLNDVNVSFIRNGDAIVTLLNGEDVEQEIRGAEVSSVVSEVSKIKAVRAHLVKLQQSMGKDKGMVMDGRDIGTVVFPNAEVKIYMQADVEVRAQRRFDELKLKGHSISLNDIKANIEERDYQDIHRFESPLLMAADAHVLDNSHLSFSEQMDWFIALLREKNLMAN